MCIRDSIKATTKGLDSTVALGVQAPYIDVALNGNGVPTIGINQDFTNNPDNYYWGFTMDHQDDNVADSLAWRADIKLRFDDAGFFKGIKGGVRLTQRLSLIHI